MLMFAVASNGHASPGPVLFIALAVFIFYVIAGWRVFVKADEPGWGVFVPIYNLYLVCKIAGRPEWWLILFFVPLVNVVFALIVAMDIAKAFSKGPGFGIGLWLLSFIFVPILGYGSATYARPTSLGRV